MSRPQASVAQTPKKDISALADEVTPIGVAGSNYKLKETPSIDISAISTPETPNLGLHLPVDEDSFKFGTSVLEGEGVSEASSSFTRSRVEEEGKTEVDSLDSLFEGRTEVDSRDLSFPEPNTSLARAMVAAAAATQHGDVVVKDGRSGK